MVALGSKEQKFKWVYIANTEQVQNIGPETTEVYTEFSNNFLYLQQLSIKLNESLWKRTFEKTV